MHSLKHLKCFIFILLISEVFAQETSVFKQTQCAVCKAVVEKIEKEIEKVSPNRKVDIGQYRLDSQGSSQINKMEYRRSEMFLSEVFDQVCKSMEEWVKARHNGQLVVLPIIIDGQMNPLLNQVEIIPDSNLNANIKLYCEMLLDENEDAALELFRSGSDNIDIKLCSDAAKLCQETFESKEEYLFQDEKDEL